MTASRPTVFISYSHRDEAWKDRLVTHLAPLRQAGLLHEVWHDREIEGGADWEREIFAALDDSSVALFLASANSLGSDYIMQTEAPRMLAHKEEGRTRIDVDRGDPAAARGHLETAKAIVERTGYRRRDPEVAVLERVLGERGG